MTPRRHFTMLPGLVHTELMETRTQRRPNPALVLIVKDHFYVTRFGRSEILYDRTVRESLRTLEDTGNRTVRFRGGRCCPI